MIQRVIVSNKIRKISKEDFTYRTKRLIPKEGDIIYSREGTIGLSIIIPPDFKCCLGQRVMLFRIHNEVINKYFRFALISKMFVRQWESKLTGATSKHIYIKGLKKYLIPLPPLSEQQRIVEKVKSLVAFCDDLQE